MRPQSSSEDMEAGKQKVRPCLVETETRQLYFSERKQNQLIQLNAHWREQSMLASLHTRCIFRPPRVPPGTLKGAGGFGNTNTACFEGLIRREGRERAPIPKAASIAAHPRVQQNMLTGGLVGVHKHPERDSNYILHPWQLGQKSLSNTIEGASIRMRRR